MTDSNELDEIIQNLNNKIKSLESKYMGFVNYCANILEHSQKNIGKLESSVLAESEASALPTHRQLISDLNAQKEKLQQDLQYVLTLQESFNRDHGEETFQHVSEVISGAHSQILTLVKGHPDEYTRSRDVLNVFTNLTNRVWDIWNTAAISQNSQVTTEKLQHLLQLSDQTAKLEREHKSCVAQKESVSKQAVGQLQNENAQLVHQNKALNATIHRMNLQISELTRLSDNTQTLKPSRSQAQPLSQSHSQSPPKPFYDDSSAEEGAYWKQKYMEAAQHAETVSLDIEQLLAENERIEANREHLECKLSELFNEIARKTRGEKLNERTIAETFQAFGDKSERMFQYLFRKVEHMAEKVETIRTVYGKLVRLKSTQASKTIELAEKNTVVKDLQSQLASLRAQLNDTDTDHKDRLIHMQELNNHCTQKIADMNQLIQKQNAIIARQRENEKKQLAEVTQLQTEVTQLEAASEEKCVKIKQGHAQDKQVYQQEIETLRAEMAKLQEAMTERDRMDSSVNTKAENATLKQALRSVKTDLQQITDSFAAKEKELRDQLQASESGKRDAEASASQSRLAKDKLAAQVLHLQNMQNSLKMKYKRKLLLKTEELNKEILRLEIDGNEKTETLVAENKGLVAAKEDLQQNLASVRKELEELHDKYVVDLKQVREGKGNEVKTVMEEVGRLNEQNRQLATQITEMARGSAEKESEYRHQIDELSEIVKKKERELAETAKTMERELTQTVKTKESELAETVKIKEREIAQLAEQANAYKAQFDTEAVRGVELTAKLDELTEELKVATEEGQSLALQIQSLSSELQAAKGEISSLTQVLEAAESELCTEREATALLKSQMQNLSTSNFETNQRIVDYTTTIDTLSKEKNTLQAQMQAMITESSATVSGLQYDLAEATKKVQELAKEKAETGQALESAQTQVTNLETKLDAQIQYVAKLKEKKRTIRFDLEAALQETSKKQTTTVAELSDKIGSLERELKTAKTEVSNKTSEISDLQTLLEMAKKQATDATEEAQAAKAKGADLGQKLAEVRVESQRAHDQMESIAREKTALVERLDSVTAEVERLTQLQADSAKASQSDVEHLQCQLTQTKQATEQADERCRTLTQELQTLKNEKSTQLAKLTQERKDLESSTASDIERYEATLTRVKDKKRKVKEEMATLDTETQALRIQNGKLNSEVIALQTKVDEATEQLATALTARVGLEEKLESALTTNARLDEQLTSQAAFLEKYEADNAVLSAKLTKKKEKFATDKSAKENLQSQLLDLTERFEIATDEAESAKKSKNETVRSLEAEIEIMRQNVEDFRSENEDLQTQLKAQANEVGSLKAKVDQLKKKNTEMYNLISEQDAMIVESEERCTQLEGTSAKKDTLITTLKKQCERAEAKVNTLVSQADKADDLLIEYEQLQDRYEELQTKQAEMSMLLKKRASTSMERSADVGEIQRLESKVEQVTAVLTRKERQVNDLEAQLSASNGKCVELESALTDIQSRLLSCEKENDDFARIQSILKGRIGEDSLVTGIKRLIGGVPRLSFENIGNASARSREYTPPLSSEQRASMASPRSGSCTLENIVNVFNEQPHLEDQSSLDDSSMDKTPEAIEESIFNASDEELVDETDDDFNLDRGIDSELDENISTPAISDAERIQVGSMDDDPGT